MADKKAKAAGKEAKAAAAYSRPRPSPFDRAYEEGRRALDALEHLNGRPRPLEPARTPPACAPHLRGPLERARPSSGHGERQRSRSRQPPRGSASESV